MKTKIRRYGLLPALATAVMVFILTGCHSARQVAGSSKPVTEMTLDEKVIDVASHNQPWTQLNLPVKVAVKSPQKLSVNGRIY
ncbi:MAG: hypothetical protein K2L73_01080, partial [Muribaculaceae bacterium]|nr:hypothetical protein [Muribaculaceae bacterium]